MNRQEYFRKRAEAWLEYLNEGRTDLVEPNVAVTAFRTAVANASMSLEDFKVTDGDLRAVLCARHFVKARQCLERLRLGVGETEQDIAEMRSHLAKVKMEPGDPERGLASLGTDETEIAFFLTSDPLKAE